MDDPFNNNLILLTEKQLSEIIRRTADAVASELRNDIETRQTPELMTKAELADYLRCDASKVNRYMSKGLPSEKFGSTPRFRKSSIDRWLQHERVQEISGEAH